EGAQVGGGRGRVEVVVALLDVLAVIPLDAAQAEEPLLQDRVAPIPEREGEAEVAAAVADTEQAVLAPAVGPRAGLVVREVAPGLAIRRVVLADRPPLALGQVRPPAPPGHMALARLGQPLPLGIHRALDHPAEPGLATLARLDRIGTRPPAHQEWSV